VTSAKPYSVRYSTDPATPPPYPTPTTETSTGTRTGTVRSDRCSSSRPPGSCTAATVTATAPRTHVTSATRRSPRAVTCVPGGWTLRLPTNCVVPCSV